MSDCDEGYNCDRCGEYVENVRESELYLRFVLGAVPIDELPRPPRLGPAFGPCCSALIFPEQVR